MRLVIGILVLIFLPLLETFNSLPGLLSWGDPLTMHRLNDYLRVFKWIMINIGFWLLYIWHARASDAGTSLLKKRTFVSSVFLIGFIQWILLLFGTWDSIERTQSELEYFHKTKHYGDYSIYVHTFDPGAMGRAYHVFYIKCPLRFGRFKLERINEYDWMRGFTFDVMDGHLFVEHLDEYLGADVPDIAPTQLPHQPCNKPLTRA